MNDTEAAVLELGRRWVEAEIAGDADTLDGLVVDDFTLVGPAGFVLDKAQWGDRYRGGGLDTTALRWEDVHVRDYGDCAVAVGVHDQEATYGGRDVSGRFRITHVAVRREGRWLLAGLHLSPMMAPPGPPGQPDPPA